jgi:tRNA(fMet)-specific endonuclease VapC
VSGQPVDAVLVDTDVYSYLMNGKGYAALYKPHAEGKLIAVSFITVGELYFGAYRKSWKPERLADLKDRLRSVTIVPYDELLCLTYARIKAEMQSRGNVIGPNDLWIAASAVRHSIPLLSNNQKHFELVPGLVLISEYQAMKEMQSQRSLEMAEHSNAETAESQVNPSQNS